MFFISFFTQSLYGKTWPFRHFFTFSFATLITFNQQTKHNLLFPFKCGICGAVAFFFANISLFTVKMHFKRRAWRRRNFSFREIFILFFLWEWFNLKQNAKKLRFKVCRYTVKKWKKNLEFVYISCVISKKQKQSDTFKVIIF